MSANYECMYLIPRDIYDKFFTNMDQREKRKVDNLNSTEIGNESGAFPDIPGAPDDNNDNTDVSSHNDSNNDDNNQNQNQSRNTSTETNNSTSTTSTASSPFLPPRGLNTTSTPNTLNAFTFPVNRGLADLSSDDEEVFIRKKSSSKKNTSNKLNKSTAAVYEYRPSQTSVPVQSTSNTSNIPITQIPQLTVQSVTPNQSIVDEGNVGISETLPPLSLPPTPKKALKSKSQKPLSPKTVSPEKITSQQSQSQPTKQKSNEKEKSINDVSLKSITKNNPRNKQKTFRCNICKEIFGYVKDLNNHLKTKHPNKNNDKQKVYTNWVDDNNKTRENILDSDDEQVNVVSSTTNHNKTHILSDDESMQNKTLSDDGSYFYDEYDDIVAKQCKLCPAYFRTQKTLERHINNIHNADKNYVSWIKHGVKRKDKSNSKISKKTKYDYNVEKPEFLCELCDMSFNYEKSLERHKKNIHDTNKDYVSWLNQGKKRKIDEVSSNNENSNIKSQKRVSKFFYKCKLCNHIFSKENALTRHIKNIHSANEKYISTLPQGQKRKTKA